MNRARRDLELANRRLDEAAPGCADRSRERLKLSLDLPGIHSRFEREDDVFNIALFDIYRFKEYHDTYEHQQRNALLAQVGEVSLNQLRRGTSSTATVARSFEDGRPMVLPVNYGQTPSRSSSAPPMGAS